MNDTRTQTYDANQAANELARFSVADITGPRHVRGLLSQISKAADTELLPEEVFEEIRRLFRERRLSSFTLLRDALAESCEPIYARRITDAIAHADDRLYSWLDEICENARIRARMVHKIFSSTVCPPETAEVLIRSLLAAYPSSTLTEWRYALSAISCCSILPRVSFEAVVGVHNASPYSRDCTCLVSLCSALCRINYNEWPLIEHEQILNQLWPDMKQIEAGSQLSTLAFACCRYNRADKLADVLDIARSVPLNIHQIGKLATAAGRLGSTRSLQWLFESAVTLEEDPFANFKPWAALLLGALIGNDHDLFLDIFIYLNMHFRPLRMAHWGPLGIIIRNSSHLLPLDIEIYVLDTINHGLIDLRECALALRDLPITPRSQRSGEMQFAGAARELMQWMIHGLINGSKQELANRVDRAMGVAFSLPMPRRNEAMFHLFARGQGAYAGAINGSTRQRFNALAREWNSLNTDELCAISRNPSAISGRLQSLISQDRTLCAPSYLPPGQLYDGLRSVAELLLVNQRDLFSGYHWYDTRWFDELTRCIEPLERTTATQDEWIVGVQWFIEFVGSKIAEMLGVSVFAHDLLNEFKMEWEGRFADASVDPHSARNLMQELVGRINFGLASTSGIATGPRKPISARFIAEAIAIDMVRTPIADVAVDIPSHLRLLLMDGQLRREVLPLIAEVRHNAEKTLMTLPEEERLYHVSLLAQDPLWLRVVVENTFDPGRLNRSLSLGFGEQIVHNICRRLRARDESMHMPEENMAPHPGRAGLFVFSKILYLPRAEDTLSHMPSVVTVEESEDEDDGRV